MEWKVNFKHYNLIFYVLVWTFFTVTNSVKALDESTIKAYNESTMNVDIFSESDRAEITKNFKFATIKNTTKKNAEQIRSTARPNSIRQPWTFSDIVLTSIFTIIIVLLIVLLFYNMKNKAIENTASVKQKSHWSQVEDLEKFDVKQALKTSLQEEDYQNSIRLNFLDILKKLSSQGYIKWTKDKGSRIYVYEVEIKAPQYVEDFKELVQIFDYIWYSEQSISKAEYQIAAPYFSNFLASIK